MKRTVLALALALVAMVANAQTGLKHVYDETINPMEQIDKAIAEARAADKPKYVICQVGGNWCPWCLRFADFMSKDADIMNVVNDNYVFAHVNYNPRKSASAEQADAAKRLMARLGNPGRFGFPVFVVLDADGNVLHTQDSGFLEEGQGYSKEKVMRFLSRWTPSAAVRASAEADGNSVVSTIMARRSVRKYLDRPVEHDKLELVAKCGINAPSGMNSQKWAVRVVESKEWIDGATAIFRQSNPDMVARDPNFKNMFRNAPNVICVATPGGESSVDAGLLGENMMIAAQSLGLGTCCLGSPVMFFKGNAAYKPYVDRLNLPSGYELCYIIAVGYPDEQPEAKPRDASKVEYVK